jgi:hypothetical protein
LASQIISGTNHVSPFGRQRTDDLRRNSGSKQVSIRIFDRGLIHTPVKPHCCQASQNIFSKGPAKKSGAKDFQNKAAKVTRDVKIYRCGFFRPHPHHSQKVVRRELNLAARISPGASG